MSVLISFRKDIITLFCYTVHLSCRQDVCYGNKRKQQNTAYSLLPNMSVGFHFKLKWMAKTIVHFRLILFFVLNLAETFTLTNPSVIVFFVAASTLPFNGFVYFMLETQEIVPLKIVNSMQNISWNKQPLCCV